MSDPAGAGPLFVLAMPDAQRPAQRLAARLGCPWGAASVHRFPDGESLPTLPAFAPGSQVIVVASLDRPDAKLLPLLFVADTARELGAHHVELVAPYLPYLRQDKRFEPRQAVTSRSFAAIVSRHFDALTTVDPHLHRYAALGEIYPLASRVLTAAPLLAAWVREHIERPLLIGPDAESVQWVQAVARAADAPFLVLEKTRRGDRNVEVTMPQAARWADCQPVLVDDIVSTAHTMMATLGHLRRAGLAAPVCVGVHAIFADRAHAELLAAGAARVVTCDTIEHPTNAIDTSGLIAQALATPVAPAAAPHSERST